MSLREDLLADTFGSNWTAMSDKAVAADMNVENRVRVRASMSGDELFQQTDEAEFVGLTDAKQQMWVSFTRGQIDPGAAANVAFVQFIFGAGPTLTALNSARNEIVSLGVELGHGFVTEGDVEDARV